MAWVYILECADGSYYTGSTVASSGGSSSTARASARISPRSGAVRLVFAEPSDSVETAFVREKQIQGWSRAKKRALIESRWDELPELSRRYT